jgi:hypothetical protein
MNPQSLCLLLLGSVVHRHGFAVEVKSRRGVCIKTYIPNKTRLEKKTAVKMRESSMQGGVTAFSVFLFSREVTIIQDSGLRRAASSNPS